MAIPPTARNRSRRGVHADRGAAPADRTGPVAVRIAGALLGLVGVANLAVGAVALIGGPQDVSTAVAIGLVVAGALTAVLARSVWQGSMRAIALGLVVFELLLLPRLVAIDDVDGSAVISLVIQVVVVVALAVAAWSLRRAQREPSA